MKATYSKRVSTTILAMLALCGLLASKPAVARDEFNKELDANPGGLLELDMESGGSVTIVAWDKNKIELGYSDSLVDLNHWDVEIKKTRNGYEITSALKDQQIDSSSLNFNIHLPRQYNVSFHSVGGGFSAQGVEGNFRGSTAGGSIALADVKGEVGMTTGGGTIKVINSTLDGRISTGGGGALIENVVGDLRATSGGGQVKYINVRNSDGKLYGPSGMQIEGMTEQTVLITTAGGGVSVKEVSSGAYIHTGGGRINVRQAGKFVIASTGGGDMEIAVEDGYVQANTGAGDVEVEISGGSGDLDGKTKISSGLGDITLIVPKGFSMNLAVDLRYTRSSNRDYRITSNLELDQEQTKKWDTSFGSPIKHIYGKAKLHGGKHEVSIQTTNGHVRIQER